MSRKLQPECNVLRIHILHVMKGSHISTMAVMVDTDKYRFFLLVVMRHQMLDSQGFGKHLEHNHLSSKMCLHVNCACTIGTRLNLDLLCVAKNGIVLELRRTVASQNHHSCQLQTNGLKGATMTKAMSFCV